MPPQTKSTTDAPKATESNGTDKPVEKEPLTPLAEASPDVQAAASAGISEGEVHALRADAGFNQLPGHEAHVSAWESSEAGKKFVKEAKDNVKEAEAAAKETHKDLDKDGVSEAEKKYRETVGK